MKDSIQRLIVEFIGPFALIFIGAGAVIATGGKDLVAIALAHGLAIGLMIAAAGHISGGHYNPAVTVGFIITGRMSAQRGAAYILAQLGGAAFGAFLLWVAFPEAARNAVQLGTPGLTSSINVGQGLLTEGVLTFFLMLAVFGTAVDSRGPRVIASLVIGLVITMDLFLGFGLTGGAMNPARAFGPALVGAYWRDQWIYWVGPIAGAAIAATLYHYVLMARDNEKAQEKASNKTS